LRAFAHHGGKLLVYHGWSDWGITPQSTLDYYASLRAFFDRHPDGSRRVGQFFRMFFVPGMGHCSGGAGTDQFDMLTPLVRWVEHHRRPDRIPAAHVTNGVVDRTRPLCVYPSEAIYRGSGSTNDQRNFRCGVRRPR
jgi:feruloyl esterase